jgi:hypothetical protein
MEGALAAVVIGMGVIGAIAVVVGVLLPRDDPYKEVGRGAFSMDLPELDPEPAPDSPQGRAVAEAEIRQMVQAKSDRRVARGEDPLDVEAEVASLTAPAAGPAAGVDEGLREEVRQLVVAQNERRARRGEPPLDVDAEVERQLRDVGA